MIRPLLLRRRLGFTLAEILIAMAVLGLLVAMVAQLLNGAAQSIQGSRKRIDSNGASRVALGIMANDLSRILLRSGNDLDYLFLKSKGNDSLYFYSESPGTLAPANLGSGISLIGYRINDVFGLERFGKGLQWSGTNTVLFLNFSNSSNPGNQMAAPTTELGYYQGICDEVFRLEFCFLTRSGGYFEPSASWKAWQDDDGDGSPNIKDVSAIVIAVACLDQESRKLVTDLGTLSDSLPDTQLSNNPANPTRDASLLMGALWKKTIEASDFVQKAKIPVKAAGAVRVYQRIYYLNWK